MPEEHRVVVQLDVFPQTLPCRLKVRTRVLYTRNWIAKFHKATKLEISLKEEQLAYIQKTAERYRYLQRSGLVTGPEQTIQKAVSDTGEKIPTLGDRLIG